MKNRLLFAAAVMLLALCHPPQLSAQTTKTYDKADIPEGDKYKGWLRDDENGSVTGTPKAQYLWINKTNFPDDAFRDQLLTDTDYDSQAPTHCTLNGAGEKGYFFAVECYTINSQRPSGSKPLIQWITIHSKDVTSLEGIGYFEELQYLGYQAAGDYAPARLTGTLDLSGNKELLQVYIRYNTQLTGINLTGLTKLNILDITGCHELPDNPDLSSCTALTHLMAEVCDKITTLDLTKNTNLTYLAAGNDTPLEKIKGIKDLTKLTSVTLNRSHSLPQSYFDFTHCPNLKTLRMEYNPQVKDLVFVNSNNTKLEHLDCTNCSIPTVNKEGGVNISDFKNLKHLECDDNPLGTLDVTENTKLEVLHCRKNQLSELNVTKNTELYNLYCDENDLTVLDVSQNTKLAQFHCGHNHLRTLDLSNNTSFPSGRNDVLHTQTSDCDLKVFDHKKIGILLPGCTSADDTPTAKAENFRSDNTDSYSEADGKVTVYDGETTDTRSVSVHTDTDGKQYLIIADAAQPAADEDLYGKHVRYAYKTESQNNYMSAVDIEVYPYVMNLHYNSVTPADKSYNNEAFHSGTLYLDYDAVVPDGAEAYIITSTKPNDPNDGNVPTADKVNLTLIAKGGTDTDVVPALTPVYVKGTDLGWYDFQDAKRIYVEGYASHMTAGIPEVMTDALIAQNCSIFKEKLHTQLKVSDMVDEAIAQLKRDIEYDYGKFSMLESKIEEWEEYYNDCTICPDGKKEDFIEQWTDEYNDYFDDWENYLEDIQEYYPEVTEWDKNQITLDMFLALMKYYDYDWNGEDEFETMYLRYYYWDYYGWDEAPTKDQFAQGILSDNYGEEFNTWQDFVDYIYGPYKWVEEYNDKYAHADEPTEAEFELAYLCHHKGDNGCTWDETLSLEENLTKAWETFRAERIEHYTKESTITNEEIERIYNEAKKSFYEVYNMDEVKAAIPEVIQQLRDEKDYNILQGVLDDHSIGASQVMTLTREKVKGTGIVGFWRYTGTKIAAHRCYISRAHLSATASASNGANGFEFNFDDDGNATGIKTINSEQLTINSDAWYTLDGRKLDGKPTQRGIYIHNGRKEVVR